MTFDRLRSELGSLNYKLVNAVDSILIQAGIFEVTEVSPSSLISSPMWYSYPNVNEIMLGLTLYKGYGR